MFVYIRYNFAHDRKKTMVLYVVQSSDIVKNITHHQQQQIMI